MPEGLTNVRLHLTRGDGKALLPGFARLDQTQSFFQKLLRLSLCPLP